MIVLSLGSNIGDRVKYLNSAIDNLVNYDKLSDNHDNKKNEIKLIKRSSFYETQPVGNYTEQNNFYNIVVIIETELSCLELLKINNNIEYKLGRTREFQNAPRTVDIDIIYFKDQIINSNRLIVPHKEYKNRKFVLVPLAEIANSFIDKTSNESIDTLVVDCIDTTSILKLEI